MRAPLTLPFIEPARVRHVDPAPEPLVEVEALEATWCHRGQAVTPGAHYQVPASIADELERRGKARRV